MPVRYGRGKLNASTKLKYHDIILSSFKFIQMMLAIACLVIHIFDIATKNDQTPHVVIFCGTYFGLTMVNAGLFYEYLIGERNPNHLEIFFCAVGGILSSICNNMTMYYAKHIVYSQKSVFEPLQVEKQFFYLARIQSVLSMLSSISYWVDLCINLDIWRSYKLKNRKSESRKNDTVLISIEEEEEGGEEETNIVVMSLYIRDEDDLQLHAFCLEIGPWCKRWWKEHFKNLFWRRKKKAKPVTEVDFYIFVRFAMTMDMHFHEDETIASETSSESESHDKQE